MTSRTTVQHRRKTFALMMVALTLAAITSMTALDSAHACRPDMEPWTNQCGTP